MTKVTTHWYYEAAAKIKTFYDASPGGGSAQKAHFSENIFVINIMASKKKKFMTFLAITWLQLTGNFPSVTTYLFNGV